MLASWAALPPSPNLLSPLIVVVGPTGSGKSALSLSLAEALGGEIISCDSVQVYRQLNIGSAKLTSNERRGIPHHLLDIIDVDHELTAGAYSRTAREAIRTVESHGHIPIVTGGTGFYLRALLDGLSPAPARDQPLRDRLGKLVARRPLALHRFLRRYDSAAAERIHANDHQKLIRAVELIVLAHQPATQTQGAPRTPLQGFSVLRLGLRPDRNLLYAGLNQRCERMFEQGLLTEAESLVKAGYSSDLKALRSLGYKQALQYLSGSLSYKDAVAECQTKTRQYAKRQLTWFRREPNIQWLLGFGTELSIQQQALDLCRAFLWSAQIQTQASRAAVFQKHAAGLRNEPK